jgi:hypothetical protein
LKEKLLKEKERHRKFKRVSEIVEAAFKMNLDQFEDTILLGAFLEISEKIQDPQSIEKWKKMASHHLKSQEEKPEQLLAISFQQDPQMAVRDVLKKMNFRWNPFRKEFCGYGNQRELENLLKESDFSIEIIP